MQRQGAQRGLRPRPGKRRATRRSTQPWVSVVVTAVATDRQINVAPKPPAPVTTSAGRSSTRHPRLVSTNRHRQQPHAPAPDAGKNMKNPPGTPLVALDCRRAAPGRGHAAAGQDGRKGLARAGGPGRSTALSRHGGVVNLVLTVPLTIARSLVRRRPVSSTGRLCHTTRSTITL